MSETTTIIFAIWGAVLGTIGTVVSVVLAIREMKKDKSQVKILWTLTDEPVYIYTGKEDNEPREKRITISVLNLGFRPVQIKNVGLARSDEVVFSDGMAANLNTLPIRLLESESVDIHFFVSEIRKLVSPEKTGSLKAIIRDAGGILYKSKIPSPIKTFLAGPITKIRK